MRNWITQIMATSLYVAVRPTGSRPRWWPVCHHPIGTPLHSPLPWAHFKMPPAHNSSGNLLACNDSLSQSQLWAAAICSPQWHARQEFVPSFSTAATFPTVHAREMSIQYVVLLEIKVESGHGNISCQNLVSLDEGTYPHCPQEGRTRGGWQNWLWHFRAWMTSMLTLVDEVQMLLFIKAHWNQNASDLKFLRSTIWCDVTF